MPETMTKLECALAHAAKGWRVMPLFSARAGACECHKRECKSPGKHPRIVDPLKQATTDEATIRRWWEMWPASNVGIATGKDSGVVVLDVDAKSGGVESIKALLEKHGDLADRVMARTGGGGFHLLFQHPGGHWANTQGTPTRPSPIGQGLDFRGDGGYVVAVGSDHVSGSVYRWETPVNGHLPAPPQWLLDALRNRGSSAAVVMDAEGEILTGNRHNTLRAWACQMRGKGMSKAAIMAALHAENATRFAEPKENDEVNRIVDWVATFQPGSVPNWREVLGVQDVPVAASESPEEAPRGLVSIRDVQPEMDALFTEGAKPGLRLGWPSLDQLYSVHRGDLTNIIAAPSAGKTTLGLNVVANMAISHDWKIAVCSTENRIQMMLADLAGMLIGRSYYANFSDQMEAEDRAYAEQFLYDHFRFIKPVSSEPFTVPYVLSLARSMGADGVIIDPFGAVSLPPARGGSNDSRIIRDTLHGVVQPFLKEEGMHLWNMVHTTKLPLDANGDMQMPNPYNATDSAGFFNAADFVISMRRPKSRGGLITEVEVQKVKDRFSGQVGRCQFSFEPRTGRYNDAGIISEGGRVIETSEDGYTEVVF